MKTRWIIFTSVLFCQQLGLASDAAFVTDFFYEKVVILGTGEKIYDPDNRFSRVAIYDKKYTAPIKTTRILSSPYLDGLQKLIVENKGENLVDRGKIESILKSVTCGVVISIKGELTIYVFLGPDGAVFKDANDNTRYINNDQTWRSYVFITGSN